MSINKKKAAAEAALDCVSDGMRLGIGTGSTAEEFIALLGEKVAAGLEIVGVPTSRRTEDLCRELGIALSNLNETPQLDLTIDGADEIDPGLSLIKGGGGALLREKMVAASSSAMIVIADDSKKVDVLGAFPLPLEIVQFGWKATRHKIARAAERLGLPDRLDRRVNQDGSPYVTDNGNFIIDASFGRIRDAFALANEIRNIPGLVEHGLFLKMAERAFIGHDDGVEELTPG